MRSQRIALGPGLTPQATFPETKAYLNTWLKKLAGVVNDHGHTFADVSTYAQAKGATNDWLAFRRARDDIETAGGGLLYVPWRPPTRPWVVGDGSASGTGIYLPSNTTVLGAGSTIINRAKATSGNNLFTIEDAAHVRVSGLTIDGEGGVRKAVEMAGVIEDVTLSGLRIFDHLNFSITYGDSDTNPATATYDGITIEDVWIWGLCGLIGDGSGIDLYCRAQTAGGLPAGRNLTLRRVTVDVSMDEALSDDHGPQAVKVNNCDGITLDDVVLRGGSVSCLTFTNGCRNVQGAKIRTAFANRGLHINDSHGAALTTETANVTIDGFTYRQDGVSSGEAYTMTVGGAPAGVAVRGIRGDGHIVLVSGADPTTEVLQGLVLEGELLNGASFLVKDPGNDPFGANVIAAATTGLDVTLRFRTETPGGAVGRLDWDTADRKVNASRAVLTIADATLSGVHNAGDDNTFAITCINGNAANAADRTPLLDQGTRTTLERLTLQGTSNWKALVRKTGGSGLRVGPITGTLTNPTSATRHLDCTNQASSSVPVGEITTTTLVLDLSGAAVDQPLLTADQDLHVLGVEITYTEASAAAGTAVIRVGDITAAGVVDDDRILSVTSEVSKAAGYTKRYINTSGTDSFATRLIARGSVLTVGTAGLSGAAGEVLVTVHLARSLTV